MADTRRLIGSTIVPDLAREIGAQVDAGVGNRQRLTEMGLPPALAAEVAAQIGTAGNTGRLIELGLPASVARAVVVTITGGTTPTPSPTLPQLAEAFIASNQLMATGRHVAPTSKLRYLNHTRHYIASNTAARKLRVGVQQWRNVTEAPVSGPPLPIDSFKVAYNGTVVDMLGGAGSMTVDGSQPVVFAPATAFPDTDLAAGGIIEIWVEGTVAAAGAEIACASQLVNSANNSPPTGGAFYFYDPVNAVAQNYAGSTTIMPTGASTGSGGAIYGMALVIVGEQVDKNARAHWGLYDSIGAFGRGAADNGWDGSGAGREAGWVAAQSDTNVSDYVSVPTKRKFMMRWANRFTIQAGTNDLRDGRTAAQLAADDLVVINDARGQVPNAPIIRCNIQPRCDNVRVTALSAVGTTITATVGSTAGITSGNVFRIVNAADSAYNVGAAGTTMTVISGTQVTYQVASAPTNATSGVTASTALTDNYTSKGIQRPIAGFGAGEARDQFHAVLAARLANGTITALADVLSVSCDPDDNTRWFTDARTESGIGKGTAGLRVGTDWIHENQTNRTLATAQVKAARASTGGV